MLGVVAPPWPSGRGRCWCKGEFYLSLRSGVLDKTSSLMCNKLVVSNIPNVRWKIHPYEHGLLDSPG